MVAHLLALILWVHLFVWGAGLAWWITPRPWQRFWPIFALPVGLTLQSIVVWCGALADLRGTNSYALFSEAIPLVIIGSVFVNISAKTFFRDVRATAGVLVASILVLLVLSIPFANYYRHNGLTTASLGSCDAADYAGGARALMEFARSDRVGFLGLTEVTRVMSIDHFFDFYLRSMHFTPCAIIALNGSIFHCATYEIIGLVTALILASAVPVVFLIARSLVGLRGWPSLGVALLFGFSPVNWYAVYQTAMAHLLAAEAIGLMTWAAWNLWKHGAEAKDGRAYSGLLLMAYALLLGSYSFIVVICLIPAIGFAGGMALCTYQWKRLTRWLLWTLLPLAAAGLIFFLRVVSIVERFAILKKYDLGWKIPYLWPDAWMGVVKDALLNPIPEPFHGVAIALLAMALVWSFAGFKVGRVALLYRVSCLAIPAVLGSVYLYTQGANWGDGANRSYNAYKLFCVFYPGILPCLCVWTALAYRRKFERVCCWILCGLLTFGVAKADLRFIAAMKNPAHLVEGELLAIQSIEARPEVTSVNMMIPDMWSRLWANAFLLKKPQYFPTHTYEGRMNTPLRGSWDLNGGVFDLTLPGRGSVHLNNEYSLAQVASPYFLRITLGDGWHEPERLRRPRTIHWVWSKGDATLIVINAHSATLKASLQFVVRSARARDVSVWFNQQKLAESMLTTEAKTIDVPGVTLAPGENKIELRSLIPAASPNQNDGRLLGFALYEFNVKVAE